MKFLRQPFSGILGFKNRTRKRSDRRSGLVWSDVVVSLSMLVVLGVIGRLAYQDFMVRPSENVRAVSTSATSVEESEAIERMVKMGYPRTENVGTENQKFRDQPGLTWSHGDHASQFDSQRGR